MRLNNIPSSKGASRSIKRIGRGEGGGRGKTSGRGHKGQKSRSGFSQRPGFESGHIPLYRRLPRRGFNNKNFRIEYAIVNVGDLARIEGDLVNPETLEAAGLIRAKSPLVKILGDGELDRALQVSAHKLSSSAVAKIEKAGGSVTLIEEPAAESSESDDASEASGDNA